MRLLIQMSHPAHVHFFKHLIPEARADGHEILVVAREKDITIDLLDSEGIEYNIISEKTSSFGAFDQLQHTYGMWKEARKFRPDIILAVGGLAAAHVSAITGSQSFVFTDSEGVTAQTKLGYPVADRIYTPETYREDHGENHKRYSGFHELAYLHPERFEPSPDRLKEYGVDPNETFSVLRFVSWNAQHDIGQSGFSSQAKNDLISALESEGKIYITSESKLPPEFEKYRLPIPPHLIHDLLFVADYYIGESGTMAIEAGLLGTPSIRSNSFAGDSDRGVFNELMDSYGIVYSTPDENDAISKAKEFINNDVGEKWGAKRKELLTDKTDVTDYMIDEINSIGV